MIFMRQYTSFTAALLSIPRWLLRPRRLDESVSSWHTHREDQEMMLRTPYCGNPRAVGDLRYDETVLHFNGVYAPAKLYLPEVRKRSKMPAVVLCHGNYSEGQDMPFVSRFAEGLACHGFLTLTFDNLCFNRGWRPAGGVIDSPEQLDFRWAAYAAVTHLTGLDCVDTRTMAIVGHSLGGSVALAVGATDERIKCVVSISPTQVSRFLFNARKLHRYWERNIVSRLDTRIAENVVRAARAVTLEESYAKLLRLKATCLIYGQREGCRWMPTPPAAAPPMERWATEVGQLARRLGAGCFGYHRWIRLLGRRLGRNCTVYSIPRGQHYYGMSPDPEDEAIFHSLLWKTVSWLEPQCN
jgi:pimeloyl-ACP methyl ester carboxylesterase